MKTLVIHPLDLSTVFLDKIYKDINNCTILRKGKTRKEIKREMKLADSIIMMGHGCSTGLFSVDQFLINSFFIIDDSFTDILRSKSNIIYIWCFASEFVKKNNLTGFCTGMFISEVVEAQLYLNDKYCTKEIETSNKRFADAVANNIHLSGIDFYHAVILEYKKISIENKVAAFNLKGMEYIK